MLRLTECVNHVLSKCVGCIGKYQDEYGEVTQMLRPCCSAHSLLALILLAASLPSANFFHRRCIAAWNFAEVEINTRAGGAASTTQGAKVRTEREWEGSSRMASTYTKYCHFFSLIITIVSFDVLPLYFLSAVRLISLALCRSWSPSMADCAMRKSDCLSRIASFLDEIQSIRCVV